MFGFFDGFVDDFGHLGDGFMTGKGEFHGDFGSAVTKIRLDNHRKGNPFAGVYLSVHDKSVDVRSLRDGAEINRNEDVQVSDFNVLGAFRANIIVDSFRENDLLGVNLCVASFFDNEGVQFLKRAKALDDSSVMSFHKHLRFVSTVDFTIK